MSDVITELAMEANDKAAEIARLKAENAKLREQVDAAHMSRLLTENENESLRELCADMWHVMWACAEQRCKHRENECYVVNGNNGALPSHDECWYERRMRELSVEVDE